MNYEKMSEKLQQILMRAVEICKSYGHASVDTIQLLKAIFEDEVLDGLFKRLNVDKREALALIDDEMNRIARASNTNPQLTQEVVRSFDEAEKWAAQHEETYLSVASVWIALMFRDVSERRFGLDRADVQPFLYFQAAGQAVRPE